MDIKDLNRSQLILLALLLSFVTSLATGITTVTLMQQAPDSVTIPITKVVRETVEKIVPAKDIPAQAVLSEEEKDLLSQLKSMEYSSAILLKIKDGEEEIIARGFYISNDIVVISKRIEEPNKDEKYIVKSVLGEQIVDSIKKEDSYSILKLVSKIDEDNISVNENTKENNNQDQQFEESAQIPSSN